MNVREGTPEDFGALREILNASPEAAQWLPESDEVIVAEDGESLAGFVVWRRSAPDEIEVLNIAVVPAFRRRGIAKALLDRLPKAEVFLEVRESNLAARRLYHAAGFHEAGLRRGYYQNPPEGAIVMRLQS
jgi:[ribosomal protein S18]-alanine N-acetyltransferase